MLLRPGRATVTALLLVLAACGTPAPPAADPPADPTLDPPQSGSVAQTVAGPLVVFLGDSLTAGFGVGEEQAFPALVGERLRERGTPIQVVNAGVSGDTTAGGRRRIDWVLQLQPDIVVVGLGANDGLRGLSVEEAEANLRVILERVRQSGAAALLLGMRLPPSLGRDYVRPFEAIYPRLAKETGVPLVPFLLEGVAARPSLNLEDGIHPNAAGHAVLARTVAPALEKIIRSK